MTLTGNTFFFPWEVSLMEWLQSSLGESATGVFSFFSMFGEELILVLLLGFLYWSWDKKLGRSVGLSVLLGLVWNPMVKNVFLRRRPYMDHEGIDILRVVEPGADPLDISAQGYSFPSGHSTSAASAYGSLAYRLKKRWATVVAIVLPLLVGISRVVVGAHYPTDVLCGWLLGMLGIAVVALLEKHLPDTKKQYALILLVSLPGLFYCKSADYYTGLGMMIGFMAGTLVEEKYIRFENTRNPINAILRVAVGAALFLGLNTLLKLPFSKDFLGSGSYPSLLVRLGRYAVASFLEFGVYPRCFKYADKIGKARK